VRFRVLNDDRSGNELIVMRVAVVSHTYVVDSNRGKLEELAQCDGIELLLVIPRMWRNRDVHHVIHAEEPKHAHYRTAVIGAWLAGFGSLFAYSPFRLLRLLKKFGPDIIYGEEEPWSIAALELTLFSAILKCRFVF